MKTKLKKTIQSWPNGTLITQNRLKKLGVYKQLTQKYVKSNWLKKAGHGAYIKFGDKVDWKGGVYTLQNNDSNTHVGGLSALELLGQSHFLPLGKTKLFLFTSSTHKKTKKPPKWFINYFSNIEIEYTNNPLFYDDLGLDKFDCGAFNILVSSTERAILEILSLIPKHMSLEHAYKLMEGKVNLRANLLQKLLESCRSIITKRLFIFIAKDLELPCYNNLNIDNINLGKGHRKMLGDELYDKKLKLKTMAIKNDNKDEVKF